LGKVNECDEFASRHRSSVSPVMDLPARLGDLRHRPRLSRVLSDLDQHGRGTLTGPGE
jgi:hypothetical protein